GRPGGRAACVPRAPTAVRRAPGSGRRMSALTERTRLGLEVLATGVVLGIAGDALLRATPWGLNAFLCTVALAAAAAWLVYRRRIAVGRDAPWLAMAAVPVFRNVVATALHVDFSAVASHLALTALWTALTAGYFWGALIRRTPPPAADAQALSLGIVPVGTALGLVNLLFLVFVVIQL